MARFCHRHLWSSGLCGYIVGKLSFSVRGAYFVIVTISFAEVVRLVALNWVELTQGPLALTTIPPMTLGLPGLGSFRFLQQAIQLSIWCSASVALSYVIITSAGGFAHRPRHGGAQGK